VRIASEWLAVVVASAGSSCAIPAGMVPPATTTPVAEAPPRPLIATYDYWIVSGLEESDPSTAAGAPKDVIATPSIRDRSILVGALKQTRLFQEIRASDEPSEFHIRVRFVSKTTSSDHGPATAFSLGIIPSWQNTSYDLTAEALTPSGSQGFCRLHDECRVTYSSLCIPYALFRSPERVQREVRENLLRAAAQHLAASPEVRALAGVDSP
jgi:hypothetical protein